MKDRLPELGSKYSDYNRVPQKTSEATQPSSKLTIEPLVPPIIVDKKSLYRGKDGKDYSTVEDLQAANSFWKEVFMRKIEDPKRRSF